MAALVFIAFASHVVAWVALPERKPVKRQAVAKPAFIPASAVTA
jgi:hypothetical protein